MTKKRLFSPFLILFLFLIFFLILFHFSYQTLKYFSAKQELSKRIAEIEELERKAVELRNLKEYLATGFYKEKEARLRFGYMKAGERVIILLPGKEKIENLKEKQGTTPSPKSFEDGFGLNFKNWWQYFFK